jgi:succinate dehydrogenase / fumarate reductase cytochrome b subunit
MFNGIRHLAWDFGYGYEIKTANFSGVIVLLLSIITTFFIWII